MTGNGKPQVLLLYPKTGLDYGSSVAPPYALLCIAAPLLEKGYDVRILDQRTRHITRNVLKGLISDELLCIGISTMTGTQIRNALDLARMVRELTGGAVPLVWGGPHPSVLGEQTLADDNVDMVVVGEGDETFLELVKALEHKTPLNGILGLMYKDGTQTVNTGCRPLLDVETLLPTPWELLDVEDYIHRDAYLSDLNRVLDIGQTSRGCPFKCGFCSSASIRQRRWRPMSVEKSLEMIEDGIRRFDLDGFWLRDDEFYINRKRARRIFEGIIERALDVGFYTAGTRVDVFIKSSNEEIETMKRAGAHTLKFGAESGSQRILDLMNKGITPEQTLEANIKCMEFDIAPTYGLMIGYPTETFDEINKTIDLGLRLKRENPKAHTETINQYTATPGTPDFDLALMHGLNPPETLEGWTDWLFDDYDLEGRHSPWYSRKERIHIGNITYMSILSNVMEIVVSSGRNRFLSAVNRHISALLGKFYLWRLKHKFYRFAPELAVARYIRHSLFYKRTRSPLKTWLKFPVSVGKASFPPRSEKVSALKHDAQS